MATIADELNAISVEHGYTGAAPKTIAEAIDALADTLAGEDVDSGRSIASAIHALAPYIGSGGGTTLGPLQGSVIDTISTPVVGEEVGTSLKCSGLKVGSQAVLGFYSESNGVSDCRVAAGVTYESMYLTAYSAEDVHDFHTYIATLDNDWKYATIEPADVVLSVVYDPDINMSRLSFVMPELDANEVLIIQQPTD